MAAPLAAVAIRYIVVRGAAAVVKTVAKQYGKKTSRTRMVQHAARKGRIPMAPAPQGPYYMGHQMRQSSGGEDTYNVPGHLRTRKSMRGRSAQKRNTPRRGAKISRMIPRRGKRCPPGYRYDRKRKMCIQNI